MRARTPTSPAPTWATPAPPTTRARRRGLTLVELLVVIAVMVVMSATVVPSFIQVAAASRLRAAARGLMAQCRYARDLAVRRQTYARVLLDPDARQHAVVVLEREEGPNGQTESSWSEATGSLGARRTLPDGVTFHKLAVPDPGTSSGTSPGSDEVEAAVTFGPDGRGEEWFVSLRDDGERVLAVHVNGTTGATTVLSPEDGEAYDQLDARAEAMGGEASP